MSVTRLLSLTLPVVALMTLAGCGRPDLSGSGSPDYAATTVPDRALVLGPGDILIHNTDGTVDLALVRDTVWMKLSDSLLNSIQHDLDTSRAGNGSVFGARIAKLVKGTVGSALHARIEIPVADLDNVHYEDGGLKFDYHDGATPTMLILGKAKSASFDDVKLNVTHSKLNVKYSTDKPVLETFSPADAQRFVDAVRGAKGKE